MFYIHSFPPTLPTIFLPPISHLSNEVDLLETPENFSEKFEMSFRLEVFPDDGSQADDITKIINIAKATSDEFTKLSLKPARILVSSEAELTKLKKEMIGRFEVKMGQNGVK